MRVLMTADTVGGVWTYALDLVRALKSSEVNVALATMGAPMSRAQSSEATALSNLEVFESNYSLEWMPEPWEDVDAAGEWLLDLEERLRPDVIHLNGYAHAALPFDAPVLAMCHSCVLSWWEAVKGTRAPREWDEYARRVRRGLRNADLVVAPSWSMLAEADRFYGPFAASRVMPNGRWRELFRPETKQKYVLTAGRAWDDAKNVRALDEAAEWLPWPVFVAGDGAEALRNLVPLGPLPPGELARRMGEAAIYAAPARYEPFGLGILEAGMSGCALVLGDIPSLRENWEGAAMFVDPNATRELKEALELLIHDADQRQNLAIAARRRSEKFDAGQMALAYVDAYRELIGGASPSRRAVML